MAEEKKTCIFGEALEGSGYPNMLAAIMGEHQEKQLGQYVMENLGDMLAGDGPYKESVTIRFTAKKMTQEEIDVMPGL